MRPSHPSLPFLAELDNLSGVDLLLQADSADPEPLSSSPGFSSLRQILRAATQSYSSKSVK